MNPALFFDTETTGLPLFKEPSEHPDQPHLVQLAASLVDLDTRAVLSSIDVIVKPDGWTIPDEPAQPVAEICSASHDDAEFGERAIKPLCDISGFEYGTPLYAGAAPAAAAPRGEYPHEQMDAMALARYKVVPSHASMLWSHAVVAGHGAQQLYVGREVECQNMARKFAGAFLDGAFAFHSMAAAPTAQAAPALEAPAAPAHEVLTTEQILSMDFRGTRDEALRFARVVERAVLAAAPQAPAAPSAVATQVIENLLQLARIVNTAVEDWGETKEDDSMEVIFHKEEVEKLDAILEFFDSLPDAPESEGVILSGPSRAALMLRAQAAPAAPAVDAPKELDPSLSREVYRACEDLPEGWAIRIDLENGYGGVKLIDPDGEENELPVDGLLSDAMRESIAAAIAAQDKEGCAESATTVFPLHGDESEESDLSEWQPGTSKPAIEGRYLREFDEGEAISWFTDGKWTRDGFFDSDIQDAPWRGLAAQAAAKGEHDE